MSLRRASLILPCQRLDDFPTYLTGDRAADLLAGWTALWHPALIAAIEAVPGWRASDELPDPAEVDAELLVLPDASRQRMAEDWCDRLRATNPNNPPIVPVAETRRETVAELLRAAKLADSGIDTDSVQDFLALGHAYLQVELLTRAMHYSTVLDVDQFTNASVAAARAACEGNAELAHTELARAFDLLADARNHVYSVDFYVLDVTLLAASTLGDALQKKLANGCPTSLLLCGELLDQLAVEHPQTLDELRRAIDSGTACIVGGPYHTRVSSYASPEKWLDEITAGQQAAQRHLNRKYEVFGQFSSNFSPVLPDVLVGSGFAGALHVSFDGGRMPRIEQCKTWWGPEDGQSIAAVTGTPLDASRPETWLKLAEKISDTLAHDHVATVLLASWPGDESEYFDDVRRAARFGPVLGRVVTLEEYFRVSREPDEWTRFHTREYPAQSGAELGANPISSHVADYQSDALETHTRLAQGLAKAIGSRPLNNATESSPNRIVLNAWNFPCTQFVGTDPNFKRACDSPEQTESASATNESADTRPYCLPAIPGCGFATRAAAAPDAVVPLAENRMLRNERLEITISETTGGIQAIRTHRDRNTRASQRLVHHRGRIASRDDSQMVADQITVTRNDALIGEIESRGHVLEPKGEPLAKFVQRVRVARNLSAALVEVELEPEQMPEGDIWRSYFASRLAWADDAIAVRRGGSWLGRETGRECVESPEWVEINDGIGSITCFGMGLPYHRRAGATWLDTLLIASGETCRRFQFAIAIDESYLTHAALGLLTAGQTQFADLPSDPPSSRGWFLHVGAKNVLVTHIEPLESPRAGVRVRLLETEGRDAHTSLTAYRPFHTAQTSDFRGNSTAVLSTVDGRVEFSLGAHRWIQIEAEFDSR